MSAVGKLVLYAAGISCLAICMWIAYVDGEEAKARRLELEKEKARRLGRPHVWIDYLEDVIAKDVVSPDQMDVKFDSIGGLEKIKESLFVLVILTLHRPELFSHGKLLRPQKGVLLCGPPGTGKTMLAKAIAKESGAVFINVNISKLMSEYFGDAQKLVAAVFRLAYKLQPAIIFIDEVDTFLGQQRSTDLEAMANIKTKFMSLWDYYTTNQDARVIVLAATNRPKELDAAILRRFPQKFEIGLPDETERVKILKVILKGERVDDIEFEKIASSCAGFSGLDLFEVCKQAAYFPVRDLFQDEKNGKETPGGAKATDAV